MKEFHLDNRRRLIFPGDADQTVTYAINHWAKTAKHAIADHGFFAVALSGGSTPKKIFKGLAEKHQDSLDWSKVWLFWSDERNVLPTDHDSNFHMAMIEAGLSSLPILEENVHRMQAEKDLEANAHAYETLIGKKLNGRPFDLIMLGMGDDGHTASLFPHTDGLKENHKLVIPNYVKQKSTWRMTFTFKLINEASQICVYVIGENKASVLKEVLFSESKPDHYPSQRLGSEAHPASWLIDEAASADIAAEMQ